MSLTNYSGNKSPKTCKVCGGKGMRPACRKCGRLPALTQEE